MNWHTLTAKDTLLKLTVSPDTGLNASDVQKQQAAYGENKLDPEKKRSLFSRFLAQFSDFMIIILIIAAGISFLMSVVNGHADFVEPAIILTIIFLNAVLGVLQEAKAERSLEALGKLSAPTASVLREGERIQVPSEELVPGDIIYLETGHYVPADARLLSSVDLYVDESSLTGESHPADKNANETFSPDTPAADRKNMVYSSSIVTGGRGMAVVTAIGMNTEVGHIARLILTDEQPMTPLQKKLAATGKTLGIAALAICAVIFVLGIFKNRPIFDMFMTSVSLAVAAIPEGLPAIVTIMLSLGVQRMARKQAVIRRLPAVETLGSATIICSDKTGTLTQNRMSVVQIQSPQGDESNNSKAARNILTLAALCNNAVITESSRKSSPFAPKRQPILQTTITGEPTEIALVTAALQTGLVKSELDAQYLRIREIPFDSVRKRMTTVHTLGTVSSTGHQNTEPSAYRVITKGAPDLLLLRCTHIRIGEKILPMSELYRSRILKQNQSMTDHALRVIAVACKDTDVSPLTQTNEELESGLTFIGMIGMIDPPRPEAKEAVAVCKRAGIRPIMITGDHVRTACAIARELGILEYDSQAITSEQLSAMPFETLCENIDKYRVFARVSPSHKVTIVKAFQSRGEVVAMTGDGVNDAPALKTADIGCAMGRSGTDVAKNAADMILMDDNFATIVAAVREGRGIYDNIRKSIHFLLSSNIGEIMCIFTAILFGLPSPLLAVQLLWVNLVTDSLPAIALGVDPPAKDIMEKAPIPPGQGMFAGGLGVKIALEGMMIGALSLIAYLIGGRTMAFAVLGLSQLFHAFNMRSVRSLFEIGPFTNKKLCLSFLICTFLQIAVISVPWLAAIFDVTPMNPIQWAITFALSICPIVIVEIQKKFMQKL